MAWLKYNTGMIENLVLCAKKGDADAFGQIYEILVEKIYRFFFFKVDRVDQAEDLTARVFEKAWQNLKSYKKDNFQAWLFQIARNTLIDFWRTRKKEKSLDEAKELTDNQVDFLAALNQDEAKQQLTCALKNLKNVYYQVIALRFFNELSVAETARAMKKSESAVRTLQHRALKKLKEIMLKQP